MAIYYLVNFLGGGWIDGDRHTGDPLIYQQIHDYDWRPSECVWIVPGTVEY